MSALGRSGAPLNAILKRLLVGRPISTHAELQHRLNKRLGLAVFSSDALSSSAYATDEILLVLILAGSAAAFLSVPIALAVATVLIIVIASYRQTVRAYPAGGGAYIVAKENLGEFPGLIAASSLLIDYVLTVSVSIAAGIAAIGAAFPAIRQQKVIAAVVVVAFMALANLRGLKESGAVVAVPAYGFLVSMGIMIVAGLVDVISGDYVRIVAHPVEAERGLTIFLVLRAFASGSTALTGVEAISNGVPAFKPPEGRNAAQTLLVLGILLAGLFLGITFLANTYGVDPMGIEEGKTVPSQIAAAVFGAGSVLFYIVQVFTALILFLAANTSYAGLPTLASILARDRYLPRVLQNRGDKLAYSNGILLLTLASAAVLIGYRADVHRIIPLYVIGVFTSFTLSQAGMVKRWWTIKTRGWQRSSVINAIGALTTLVVLGIVATTKFALGAYQVIILIPLLALGLRKIRTHYSRISEELRMEHDVERIRANRAIVLVSPFLGATLKALTFARAVSPRVLRVVAFRVPEVRLQRIRRRWDEIGIKTPIEATGHRLADLVDYVRGFEPSAGHPMTLVIPDPQSRNRLAQLLRGRLLLRVKGAFLAEPGVVVVSVPFRPGVDRVPDRLMAPARFSVLVLVSGVHRATVRALDYASSLQPSTLKAVTISTDGGGGADLLSQWQEWEIGIPLEVLDSPYRSVIKVLVREVNALAKGPNDVVAVVIPEFLLPHWWQHLLHGQTALLIKTALLFQPNVIVIDVPFPIQGRAVRDTAGTLPARG